MATNAEKQAAYRTRHLQDGESSRINHVVSTEAKQALARLAKHRQQKQKTVLEDVLIEAARATFGSENKSQLPDSKTEI